MDQAPKGQSRKIAKKQGSNEAMKIHISVPTAHKEALNKISKEGKIMNINDFDCRLDMTAKDHHAEAAFRGSSSGGNVQAILAVDDTLRTLVALQERQTLALERLAAAIEATTPAPASQAPLRLAVSWTEGTA
ncbi:hypothetical protein [Streptomyces sp. MB09-02B]|uniref:hypothetical protein n=1 Tax=Streptomyces sp. MB09-02B TaxID=3028667 RepID=UPI0029A4F261|nr:hypothetical protein [Streptomyces sp. MB09-02B]MDX3641431.1 hypothetical protein [Streptomyces sp. MB09-02B]